MDIAAGAIEQWSGLPGLCVEALDIRVQRVVGKVSPPQHWGEFDRSICWVAPDTLEHVDQVGIGIHVVPPAGGHQALDDVHILGTDFRPAKQPVPFAFNVA